MLLLLLLLLLLLGLVYFYCYYFFIANYLVIVRIVVRFLLCDVGKLNFGTSLYTRYVSGPACMHTKVGRRVSRDTQSLLLLLAAASSSSCRW